MKSTQPRLTPREQALTDREQHETTARTWVRDMADSQFTLAELVERSGSLILDSPAEYEDLAMQIGQRRAKIAMADKAIEEASRRWQAASRDALLAEAAELDTLITAQEQLVTAYEAETARLLAPLVAHTGRGWSMDPRGPVVPKDHGLRERLRDLQAQQDWIRAAADRVPPLDLTDERLARASIRLLEVTGELDDYSRRNIDAVAAGLRAEADALEDQVGSLVWELKQAQENEYARLYGASNLPMIPPGEAYVLHQWQPAAEEHQERQQAALKLRSRQAQLQVDAAKFAVAADRTPAAA